jgi:hypothetical protein
MMAGGYGAGDPPDPIPNSEVKTRCADGTAGATRWESTAPPAYLVETPVPRSLGAGVSSFPHLPNYGPLAETRRRRERTDGELPFLTEVAEDARRSRGK